MILGWVVCFFFFTSPVGFKGNLSLQDVIQFVPGGLSK